MDILPVLQVCRASNTFRFGGQNYTGDPDDCRIKPFEKYGIYFLTHMFCKIQELVSLVFFVVDQEKFLQGHDVAVVVIPRIPFNFFPAQQTDFLESLLNVCLFEYPVGKSLVFDFFIQPDNHQSLFLFGREQFVGIKEL